MNDISGIIGQIMFCFGIEQVPQTASELIWCIVTILVGLFVVKYCMLFILTLMKEMVKIR
jgi:hypothetical protein